MSYLSLQRLREDVAWVVHTQRVITLLESLFSSITDAVAAQRGYTIAGRGDFIERYQTAVRGAHEDIDALRRLLTDNPAQQQRFQELVRLVGERERFAERVTELLFTASVNWTSTDETAFVRGFGVTAASNPPGGDTSRKMLKRTLLDTFCAPSTL